MKTKLGQLRLLALLEGISLFLLCFTMILKYGFDIYGPNKYIGNIHGILFILYCIWVLLVAKEYKWPFQTIVMAVIAGFLPFGTFIADAKIFRKEAEF